MVDATTSSKTYTFYIHDDRYSVPSLDAVVAADDKGAERIARSRVAMSPHYGAIEVFQDDREVATVAQDAAARR